MFHLLAKHSKLIILWGVLLGVVAGGASLLFPKQYSAESKVLVISRDRAGVDPYTQAKSAERIGESLAAVMQETDFYTKVMESNLPFNRARWQKFAPDQEYKRRKQWERDVQPEVIYNTSLLNIKVYSDTRDDAKNFATAVANTITSRAYEYVGGDVQLKEVSSPLVSRWSARPNSAVNGAVGFVVGILLASMWVARYKKHHVFGGI